MSKTNIVVNLQVEGLHKWPGAAILVPEVGFLSHPHRHMFHITAKVAVKHDDREVEIIMFKRELHNYFIHNYYDNDAALCDFGPKSCEMLAKDLMEAFDLEYCQVLEDGENGAEIYKW